MKSFEMPPNKKGEEQLKQEQELFETRLNEESDFRKSRLREIIEESTDRKSVSAGEIATILEHEAGNQDFWELIDQLAEVYTIDRQDWMKFAGYLNQSAAIRCESIDAVIDSGEIEQSDELKEVSMKRLEKHFKFFTDLMEVEDLSKEEQFILETLFHLSGNYFPGGGLVNLMEKAVEMGVNIKSNVIPEWLKSQASDYYKLEYLIKLP